MGSEVSKEIDKTPANIFRILCDGYIRRIEEQLHPKFIPFSIYYICYKFYHYCNYIIYLSQNDKLNPNRVYITDLDTDNTTNRNNCIKCNIMPLNENKNNLDIEWDIVNAGIHYQKRFPLQTDLIKQIMYKSKNNYVDSQLNNGFDVIFKCGGRVSSSQTPNDSVMALILNPLYKSQAYAYYWKLPSLTNPTCGNFVLYSNKYGLLSIGGETHNSNDGTSKVTKTISNLLFSNNNNNIITDWKWNDNQIMKLSEAVYQPCCAMIDNENIVVIAGRYGTARTSAEIYQVENNKCIKLKDINIARYGAGIFFNEFHNKIYLGGGCQFGVPLDSVEYYDLHKNMSWSESLPKTNMTHDYYPIIWSDLNHSLLYIASINSNSIESIDIRINSKSWTLVYGQQKNNNQKRLQDLFQTQFVSHNIQSCRLLK